MMWWLSSGDVVAQLGGCGGSVGELWWLSWGDVVAQLVKATELDKTATQQFRVRSRHPPQSPEGRKELWLRIINKSRDVRRPFPSKKRKKKKHLQYSMS
jgi:hypothetical protein